MRELLRGIRSAVPGGRRTSSVRVAAALLSRRAHRCPAEALGTVGVRIQVSGRPRGPVRIRGEEVAVAPPPAGRILALASRQPRSQLAWRLRRTTPSSPSVSSPVWWIVRLRLWRRCQLELRAFGPPGKRRMHVVARRSISSSRIARPLSSSSVRHACDAGSIGVVALRP